MTCSWSSAIHRRPRRTATTRSRNGTDRTSPSSVRLTPSPPVPATCWRSTRRPSSTASGTMASKRSTSSRCSLRPELHRPEDDEFTGLLSRRPAFELALRLSAAEHPRIEIRCPALITGLLHRGDANGVQIVGVQIDDDIEEPSRRGDRCRRAPFTDGPVAPRPRRRRARGRAGLRHHLPHPLLPPVEHVHAVEDHAPRRARRARRRARHRLHRRP